MFSRKQFQTGEVVFIILKRVNGEIHTDELCLPACGRDKAPEP